MSDILLKTGAVETGDMPHIIFGNTGFHVVFVDGIWEWHFTPEGQNNPKEVADELKTKYIRMFILGFGEFLRWRDTEKFQSIKFLESRTNEGMKDFLLSFFGEDNLQITRVGPKYVVRIEVEKILKQNNILETIRNFEKSALNNPFTVYE